MTYQHLKMSQAQIDEFLQVPRFAVIGTIRKKGAPQLTPVWYLYEDGQVYVWISINSAKYRNLTRDPRVCICIAAPPTHDACCSVQTHHDNELG